MENTTKMKTLERLTNWLRRKRNDRQIERVVLTVIPERMADSQWEPAEPAPAIRPHATEDPDIDFSRTDDLETYTENLNVPSETIERWISAGLLYPEEIRIAEKMVQILRQKGDAKLGVPTDLPN